MKKTMLVAATFLFIVFPFRSSASQAMDLSGIWEGTTYIPDRAVYDTMTIEFAKDNGSYLGWVSDSLGMATQAEIRNFTLEDDTLTFDITIFDGEQYQNVHIILTIEGEELVGSWEVENGVMGDITMERKR